MTIRILIMSTDFEKETVEVATLLAPALINVSPDPQEHGSHNVLTTGRRMLN